MVDPYINHTTLGRNGQPGLPSQPGNSYGFSLHSSRLHGIAMDLGQIFNVNAPGPCLHASLTIEPENDPIDP